MFIVKVVIGIAGCFIAACGVVWLIYIVSVNPICREYGHVWQYYGEHVSMWYKFDKRIETDSSLIHYEMISRRYKSKCVRCGHIDYSGDDRLTNYYTEIMHDGRIKKIYH